MAFVITEKCVGVCDTGCVDVCPVDCIHGPLDKTGSGAEVEQLRKDNKLDSLQLYINPEECIDCMACEPQCPVDAIVPSEDEAPEDAKRNKEFFM